MVFSDRMAKWGEGDPRWIVEERPDATNVNNWHWTEKNADQWSKAKIKVIINLKLKVTEIIAYHRSYSLTMSLNRLKLGML